jgi:hypothetical protein
MTVQLLSFPFRRNNKGEVVTKDDTSPEYCAERLAIMLGTQPGERVMVPTFGVSDPAFEGFVDQALRVQVGLFGLPVDIGDITHTYVNDAQEKVSIQFDMSATIYTTRNR